MTTVREALTQAVQDRLAVSQGLPASVRGEDDPRTGAYVPVNPADPTLEHFLALLDEGCDARPGCSPVLGAGGVVYDWDLKLVAAYSVRTADGTARKTQRDAGVAAIATSLLPDNLSVAERYQIAGVANWAWIEPADLRNDVYDGDVQLGVARIPLTIWFSATDPAA